jgi:hypothetical protein
MKKIALMAVVCAFVTVPALADYGTVDFTATGTVSGLGTTGTIYAPYIAGGYNLENGLNVQIGEYGWTLGTVINNIKPNPYGISSVADIKTWGFCIEMQTDIGQKQPYSIVDVQNAPVNNGPDGPGLGMGDFKANEIRELWTAHIGDVKNATTAAAFQAAVWEIVYEDVLPKDVTTYDHAWSDSTFGIPGWSRTSGPGQLANQWLADIANKTYAPANLVALSNAAYQDYIVQVPVPAAALLCVFGLSAAGLRLRRFA